MATINALAALEPGKPLQPYSFDPGELRDEQVEIAVDSCGICHSDLSMLDNDWGQTTYPLVPGHEVSGRVVAVGSKVKNVKEGDRVGLGWFAESCQACPSCMSGDHNLCSHGEQTIVNRPGGFAERVRCHWMWALPLPDGLDPAKAGPLFCGGITVFNPLVQYGVRPTDRVGIVGIGGLGHLAVQFANKWGCEVIAFSSDASKEKEIRELGAHRVVSSREPGEWEQLNGTLDFLLVTVNVTLDWAALLQTLAPRGKLHFVGAVLEPLQIPVFTLLMGQRSVSATPLGSPATNASMLEFCARHDIQPVTETFPMSKANEALEYLRTGKPRYRIVLQNDL
jgi:alcohol/geraniol dehydrogenase (NADP+)